MRKLPDLVSKLRWPASFTPTRTAFALKIAIIFAATITVFYQDFALIFTDALQNQATSYILAVPFILAYLVYRKRKMLRAVMPLTGQEESGNTRYLSQLSGVLLTATAVLLYWYGSYTLTPVDYHMFTLPLFTAGLLLILFNPQTLRQLALPIAILFFLTPPPSEILDTVGSTLQGATAQASNAIINAFNIPSTLTMKGGNPLITIFTANGTTLPFPVDLANSSIYSLIGFTLFAVFTAYIVRDKPWKKAALITIGFPLIYLLNIARIAITLLIGHDYGIDLALTTFNALGGLVLILLGALILLLISEKAFKTHIFSITAAKCVQCNPEPQANRSICRGCGRIVRPATARLHKSDAVRLAVIILTVGLLLSIEAPVFALTQSPLTIPVNTPSSQQHFAPVLPQNDQYAITFLYEDLHVETQAKQDTSLAYTYTPLNKSSEPILATLEIAPTQLSLQAWETSFAAWPLEEGNRSKISQIDIRDIQLTQNPLVISRYFVFEYTTIGKIQAILYWYSTAVFMINSTLHQKNVRISLQAFPSSTGELPALRGQLATLAKTIATYWQSIQTWSTETSFIISQNGIALLTATSLAIALTLFYYETEARKQRKTSLAAMAKLSSSNREIVEAVRKTKKPATLENVAATLQQATQEKMTTEQLEQRLLELEKAGLTRASVYSHNDEPIQTWKT